MKGQLTKIAVFSFALLLCACLVGNLSATATAQENNSPPNTPCNPFPATGATNVPIDSVLSWTGGDPDAGDTVTYDISFGSGVIIVVVSRDQIETTYNPGTLNYNTKYYWVIHAYDSQGTCTKGPLWEFTTSPASLPLSVNFDGWYVDGVKVTTATTDDTVTARITLSGGKSGQYEMRIKRDIVWATDEVIKRRAFYYDGGSATEELSFNPPYATGEASTDGYFVVLVKDGYEIWGQINAFPPRLRVTQPPPNQPPTAHIDSISPSPVKQGEPVSFSGHGTDPDGTVVGYTWRSSIDGQLSTSSSFSASNLSEGTHTIYFKVRDDRGLWSAEISRTLTINPPNRLPTAYIDSISPGKAKKGEEISFSGHGTDPDGSVVGYSWRSSLDGQLSTSSSFTTSELSEGTHTIYFKVKDNNGAWSEEVTGTVIIIANKPPEARIDSISPNRVKIGETVSFSGCGSDSDGSVVGYSWRSSLDGQLSTSSSFTTSELSEGTHIIYFKVKDNDGQWSEEVTKTVTIEPNKPPVAHIDSISPSRIEETEEVSFTGHGTDPDGSVVGYSWRSSIDGQLGTSSSFSTSGLSVGKHTIYFKVKDNDGLWSEEVTGTLTVDRPGPYVELYGHRTEVDVGEEVILNLSVINPITSAGTLTVQLTLSIPSGWSITSSGFGHGAGGLRTNTYDIEQGPNPRTIDVHILANEPYDGVVTGYLDYYFAKEEEDKYHKEVTLPVTAAIPEIPVEETPQPKKGAGFFSCSAPAQGAPPPSGGELLFGFGPMALCWGSIAGCYGIVRWRRRK